MPKFTKIKIRKSIREPISYYTDIFFESENAAKKAILKINRIKNSYYFVNGTPIATQFVENISEAMNPAFTLVVFFDCNISY